MSTYTGSNAKNLTVEGLFSQYTCSPNQNTCGTGNLNQWKSGTLSYKAYPQAMWPWKWLEKNVDFDQSTSVFAFNCSDASLTLTKFTANLVVTRSADSETARSNMKPLIEQGGLKTLVDTPWLLGPPIAFSDSNSTLIQFRYAHPPVAAIYNDALYYIEYLGQSPGTYDEYKSTFQSNPFYDGPFPVTPGTEVAKYMYSSTGPFAYAQYQSNYGYMMIGEKDFTDIIRDVNNNAQTLSKLKNTYSVIGADIIKNTVYDLFVDGGIHRSKTEYYLDNQQSGYTPLTTTDADLYSAFQSFMSSTGSPALITIRCYMKTDTENVYTTETFMKNTDSRYNFQKSLGTPSTFTSYTVYDSGSGALSIHLDLDLESKLLNGAELFFNDLFNSQGLSFDVDLSAISTDSNTLSYNVDISVTAWGQWTVHKTFSKELYKKNPMSQFTSTTPAQAINWIDNTNFVSLDVNNCEKAQQSISKMPGTCALYYPIYSNNLAEKTKLYLQYVLSSAQIIMLNVTPTPPLKPLLSTLANDLQTNSNTGEAAGILCITNAADLSQKITTDCENIIAALTKQGTHISDLLSNALKQLQSNNRMIQAPLTVPANSSSNASSTPASTAESKTDTSKSGFPTWAYYVIGGVVIVAVIVTIVVVLKKKGII